MSAWVYELLHRLTFVVHVLLAGYVAGGTLWLSLHGVRRLLRGGDDGEDPIAATLRDWLPFVLGLAITFGVVPLLLVQLFDGQAFYTANLLLSHRFMALLPALIVGFYLLYVQKAKWSWVRSRVARCVVPFTAFLCFAFTASSWSENHLLAQSRSVWPAVYANGAGFFSHSDLPWRLLVFGGVALQATAGLLAAQNRQLVADNGVRRRLGWLALVGIAGTVAGLLMHPPVPGVSLLGLDGAGLAVAELVTCGAWLWAWRTNGRVLAPAVVVAALLLAERTASLRDAVRTVRGGGGELAGSASSQGFYLFVASLVTVTAAIVWCVLRVRRELAAPRA